MSKGMLAVGIVFLSVCALVCTYLISNYQNSNELDYYLLEETTESAMIDAIDYTAYRDYGTITIDREKFLESFIRRFADSVDANRDYDIKIIDFNETPPKVSIQVNSKTIASVNGESAGIVNKVDAILETKYDENKNVNQAINANNK